MTGPTFCGLSPAQIEDLKATSRRYDIISTMVDVDMLLLKYQLQTKKEAMTKLSREVNQLTQQLQEMENETATT